MDTRTSHTNNNRIFSVAGITGKMINRVQELETLRQDICKDGKDTRVIIVKGKGGLGKTRLLSEALWHAGHDKVFPHLNPPSESDRWNKEKKAVVSDLIDLTEVRLHTSLYFLERMSRSFNHPTKISFDNFEIVFKHYKQTVRDRTDFRIIKEEAEKAINEFFDDYAQAAENHRLVWALDTAEQLSLTSAPWLLEKDLLYPKDFDFSIQQQLLDALQKGNLPNTTLILVGRPEARFFFDQLKSTADGNDTITVKEIDLVSFTEEDVRAYLKQLSQDYRNAHPDAEDGISDELAELGDSESAAVIHLYTGGQPVRLALFLDVLMEGKQIPEALQDTRTAARERVGWTDKTDKPNPEKLAAVQAKIEKEFINLLFRHTDSRYPLMLQALVRARRGLNAKEMTLVLDYLDKAETGLEEIEVAADIKDAFDPENKHSLRRFSFVKEGVGGRLILQDEMYRIYDRHMGNDPQGKRDEGDARQKLYKRLINRLGSKIKRLKEERRYRQEEAERALRWETPARVLSMAFRTLTDDENTDSIALDEAILDAETEYLHYHLRIDPDIGFNDVFDELTERYWLAGNRDAMARLQFELQQFINDRYLRPFITLKARKLVPGDDLWHALERGIQQNEIILWIKRFWIRENYRRAIEFAEAVEKIIPKLDDELLRRTLEHPFSVSERTSWREFNRIFLGKNLDEVVENLKASIEQMKQVLKDGTFAHHPVEVRLQRAIGAAYNNLGYARANTGDYWDAADDYAEGLKFLRDTNYWSQQAAARNNLARVLAERGLITRGVRIAHDGLNIRRTRIGSETQIAYSHNTLALIYNTGRNSEKAWPHAALAMLYFRKLQNRRGLGMALLQLGEALRRLASTASPLQIDRPEEVFNTALYVISEAVDIFGDGSEVIRQIEADIELGCVYRDYLRYLLRTSLGSQERIDRYGNLACTALERAREKAHEEGFKLLEFDAADDLAWTYYYLGYNNEQWREKTREFINKTLDDESFIPVGTRFREKEEPPKPDAEESRIFLLAGKLWTLKGRMAISDFKRQGNAILEKYEDKGKGRLAVRKDEKACKLLKEAAEAFVLALAYNRLYSPRAISIAMTLDDLYKKLISLNKTAMEDFYKYQQEARKAYNIDKLITLDPTDLDDFLKQSFGDFLGIGFDRRLVSVHIEDNRGNSASNGESE